MGKASFKENPLIQTVWRKIRLSRILRAHRECAQILHPLLEDYFEGRLETYSVHPLKELPSEKIIWQYWGQGMEDASMPEIVRICLDSVERYKGGYHVIRLTDDTIGEYVELPRSIHEKLEKEVFTKTFFSDFLRVMLLSIYGGVWLDATVLLTGEFPELMGDKGIFLYQRSEKETEKAFWEGIYAPYWSWHPRFKVRMLSSILCAKKHHPLIVACRDILLYWCVQHDYLPDYFLFQILYQELVIRKPEWNCPIVSDCLPHLLQIKVNHPEMKISFPEIFESTTIHKMTYFNDAKLEDLKDVLKIYG